MNEKDRINIDNFLGIVSGISTILLFLKFMGCRIPWIAIIIPILLPIVVLLIVIVISLFKKKK